MKSAVEEANNYVAAKRKKDAEEEKAAILLRLSKIEKFKFAFASLVEDLRTLSNQQGAHFTVDDGPQEAFEKARYGSAYMIRLIPSEKNIAHGKSEHFGGFRIIFPEKGKVRVFEFYGCYADTPICDLEESDPFRPEAVHDNILGILIKPLVDTKLYDPQP